MKVWKIITDLTVDESENLHDIFTEEDGNVIREMDENMEIYSWDFIEGDIYIPYLICSEAVVYKISELCDNYAIKFGPIDITEEFLLGLHDIPDSDFDQYRVDNLTEDLVYKKVKKFGASSLDSVDKYILENS
jgi:hypothetical protein